MGKGEIACYEQFLLFPQCFKKACFPGPSKGVIEWEWVKIVLQLFQAEDDDDMPDWVIAVTVIGSVVAVVIIALIIYVLVKL